MELFDLIFILEDGTNIKKFGVYKKKLICYEYFNNLLNKFKEKDNKEINIIVPNVLVSYDIIMDICDTSGPKLIYSGQNIPKCKYIFELIKCKNFFGLDIDKEILTNLDVEPVYFEDLLMVIDLFGFSDDMIKLIIKNIPFDYDLKKLSKELLEEIIRVDTKYGLISTSSDDTVKIWDLGTGMATDLVSLHGKNKIAESYFIQSKNLLVIGQENNEINFHPKRSITIWDIETKEKLYDIKIGSYIRTKCIFSVDENIIAGENIINYKTGKVYNFDKKFTAGNVSRDGKLFAIAVFTDYSDYDDTKYKEINIYDKNNFKNICTLTGHKQTILCLDFSPNNDQLVTGSYDNHLIIWDIARRKKLYKLYGPKNAGWVCAVCYSNDGTMVASGSDCIKLWNPKNGELIKILDGHTKYIWSLCFNHDDKQIISGSLDNGIKIWNIENGMVVHSLCDHKNEVIYVNYFKYRDTELVKKIKDVLIE